MAEMKLRKLANFASELEAKMLEGMLSAARIPCVLNNAEFVANFWQYGNAVGGVTVQVAEQDWDAAQAVLNPDASTTETWACPACGTDVEAGFDSCWKCARSSVPEPLEAFDQDGDEICQPSSLNDTAADSVDEVEPTVASEILQRAWKASIVGFMVPLGFLNCYSFYLLFIHVPTESLTPAELRRFMAACVANSVALSFELGLFFWFY